MSHNIRVALTETKNVFSGMPTSAEKISDLVGRMREIASANVEHHISLMKQAAAQSVQAICFGELFTGPYFALSTDPMWLAMAEDPVDGPTITALRQAAQDMQMLVVAPIYEMDPESGKRFNTAVVVEKDGRILGTYRKTHIPQGTNDMGSFHEKFYYEASDGQMKQSSANISKRPFFPVFESSVGRIAVSICYDRHFPGVMKALAEEGAQLVFNPAVTFGTKSQAMWHMEFAVDAARHNLFIGGSNRLGAEPPFSQEYFGESYFVGPNGSISNISDDKEIVIADLDLEELSKADPSGWNFARDTRPEIY